MSDLQKATTGRLVSELGVRTVLSQNLLTENHVSEDERAAHLQRMAEILDGTAGVGHSKVVTRTLERNATGRWN